MTNKKDEPAQPQPTAAKPTEIRRLHPTTHAGLRRHYSSLPASTPSRYLSNSDARANRICVKAVEIFLNMIRLLLDSSYDAFPHSSCSARKPIIDVLAMSMPALCPETMGELRHFLMPHRRRLSRSLERHFSLLARSLS